jgi:dolichol-phosphate mannosyltransferase
MCRSWSSTTAAPTAPPTGPRRGRRARRRSRSCDRTEKTGLGAAYRAGFATRSTQGAEICVQMDADLSHDPAVLPALVSNVEHGADLAIGSRYVPGGVTVDWPRRRRHAVALGQPLRGRRARPRGQRRHRRVPGVSRSEALERMEFEAVRAEGYGFQVEMTYRIVRIGGQDRRVPDHLPRPHARRVEDLRLASSTRRWSSC